MWEGHTSGKSSGLSRGQGATLEPQVETSTGDCMVSGLSLLLDHLASAFPGPFRLVLGNQHLPSFFPYYFCYCACPSFPLRPCQRPVGKAAPHLLLHSHCLDTNVLLNATLVRAGHQNQVLGSPPVSSVLPSCHSSDSTALLVLEYLDVRATTACSSCRGLGGI